MAGGNDGLNTIVPYTDSAYYQARAHTRRRADRRACISMSGWACIPRSRRCCRCGSRARWRWSKASAIPIPTSRTSPRWTSGRRSISTARATQGWLGKYRRGHGGQRRPSLPVAGGRHGAADGAQRAQRRRAGGRQHRKPIACSRSRRQQHDSAPNARIQTLLKLYNTYPRSAPYAALLDATAQSAVDGAKAARLGDLAATRRRCNIRTRNFAKGLQVLAEVIVQGLGLRVGYVTLGGFDTHGAAEEHPCPTAPTACRGPRGLLYRSGRRTTSAENVVVMTWSEFGRRVEENASQGTDHGTAAPLFVLGNAVQGGVYGEPPDLTHLDANGNLVFTTDFRSVYATVLERWLGAPASAVLGGNFNAQGFLPPA